MYVAQAISRHNSKVLKGDQQTQQQTGCNCDGGAANCPVQGECKTKCVVYEASITETVSGKTETYTGLTSRTFKQRYNEHCSDTRNPAGRHKSKFSLHIWDLKDRGVSHEIEWKLKDRAPTYNPVTKKCKLCLKEIFFIMYRKDGSTLNKRSEVFNTCRHRTQDLLTNLKT